MRKTVRRLLKASGIIIAAVVILLATAALLLNTDKVQNWLLQRAVTMLKEQLGTEVSVGHVSVNVAERHLTLSDVEVDDRQGRRMLRMESLTVGLDPQALWQREVVVTDARINGLKAQLCKPASPTDSTANYQFLVEAFKASNDAYESHETDKAHKPLPIAFRIATAIIDIDSLHYATDNGRPRRNTGKPHHGAFDAGHLDISAAMKVKLGNIMKDGLHVVLTDCRAVDRGSGLQVDSLRLQADIGKDSIRLKDVKIRMPHTTLSFAEGTIHPSPTAFHYSVPKLTATTQIRDIAKPFAPILKNFTTPLHLECGFSGDADGMRFDRVSVATTDRHLHIKATGNISHLREKHRLHVHFDVSQMTALNGMKERIISHFPVKKFMMKQLHALGRIDYRGHFDVLHKKEAFAGRLGTQHGSINFRFAIDEHNKYLSGTADTKALELGRIMDMKDLGSLNCRADFRFDISKPRTAKMRQQKGGKLPIGNIEAEVREGHYKFVTMRNVSATINSDGALAEGRIVDNGKLIDLTCNFSFTDTDQMQKLKIKPGIRLHRKKETTNNKQKKKWKQKNIL